MAHETVFAMLCHLADDGVLAESLLPLANPALQLAMIIVRWPCTSGPVWLIVAARVASLARTPTVPGRYVVQRLDPPLDPRSIPSD